MKIFVKGKSSTEKILVKIKRGKNGMLAGEVVSLLNKIKPLKEIERNIIKKYIKDIWSKFTKVKEYDLVQEGIE